MESENSPQQEAAKELHEQPGRYNQITIDLIRHGQAKYGNTSPDLTEKGIAQIAATANELSIGIQPNERVVIWNSPAQRTKDSAQVIRPTLEHQGHVIAKQKEISSLRQMKINDLEFVQQLFGEAAVLGRPDTAFMTHPEFAKLEHEKMETRPQVEKRIDRVMNYLRYLVEHVDFQNQPLRLIMVSHFEVAEPIAKEVFGFEQAFQPGDDIQIQMRQDRESKQTEIYFKFRGEERGPFGWDKDKRELIKG